MIANFLKSPITKKESYEISMNILFQAAIEILSALLRASFTVAAPGILIDPAKIDMSLCTYAF